MQSRFPLCLLLPAALVAASACMPARGRLGWQRRRGWGRALQPPAGCGIAGQLGQRQRSGQWRRVRQRRRGWQCRQCR